MTTKERLQELFDYDADTGHFTRKVSKRTDRIGEVAGAANTKGYLQIRVDGRLYVAHKLAWLWVKGEFPSVQIDHRNRIRDDNRISNLRLATNKQNGENREASPRSTTGFRNVSYEPSRKGSKVFRVVIGHHYKNHAFGLFASADEANLVACAARDRLYTHHDPEYSE